MHLFNCNWIDTRLSAPTAIDEKYLVGIAVVKVLDSDVYNICGRCLGMIEFMTLSLVMLFGMWHVNNGFIN